MNTLKSLWGIGRMIQVTLKNQLKLYLERLDLTAAQLSRKAGVSQQVLSTWLQGGEPRKMDQVKKVADALGTTVDNLCFGDGLKGEEKSLNLDEILGDEWISGLFEVKLRRVKRGKS